MIARRVLVAVAIVGANTQSPAQTRLHPVATIAVGCKPVFVTPAPSGREIIATCGDNKLRFFTVPDGKLRLTIDGGKTRLAIPTYSANGKRIGAGDEHGTVRIYDVSTGAIIKAIHPDTGMIPVVALSSDGRHVAAGPFERPVQLWNVDKAARIASLENPFSGTSWLAFSPDDKVLSSADNDGVVRSYDAATGKILSRYDSLLMEIFSLAFSPDSKRLAIGGADRIAVVVDPRSGTELQRLSVQDDPIAAVILLGDGKTLVASMFDANGGGHPKNTIAWDLLTGKATVIASGTNFSSGGLLSDGRLMVATTEGSTVKLWSFP